MLWRAAELGQESARQHVPGLKHQLLVELPSRLRLVRPVGTDGDPAQRIDIDDPAAGCSCLQRLDPGNRSTAERHFELPSPALGMRPEEAFLAGGKRKKTRLVYRREPAGSLAAPADVATDGKTVVGEPFGKLWTEQVQSRRIAIVEEIPDHLDAGSPGGFDERSKTREVVSPAALIDERPAHCLAGAVDAEFREIAVILFDRLVVTGGHDLIEPIAVQVIAGRALEAGQEEAPEHR